MSFFVALFLLSKFSKAIDFLLAFDHHDQYTGTVRPFQSLFQSFPKPARVLSGVMACGHVRVWFRHSLLTALPPLPSSIAMFVRERNI